MAHWLDNRFTDTAERQCQGKWRFASKTAAKRAARRHGRQRAQRAYRCPHCNGFHLGNRQPKEGSNMTTVDISEPIADLCTALGLERTNVLRLNLTPSKASAWVAKVNEDGKKYVDPTTNEVAVDVFDFEVTA